MGQLHLLPRAWVQVPAPFLSPVPADAHHTGGIGRGSMPSPGLLPTTANRWTISLSLSVSFPFNETFKMTKASETFIHEDARVGHSIIFPRQTHFSCVSNLRKILSQNSGAPPRRLVFCYPSPRVCHCGFFLFMLSSLSFLSHCTAVASVRAPSTSLPPAGLWEAFYQYF